MSAYRWVAAPLSRALLGGGLLGIASWDSSLWWVALAGLLLWTSAAANAWMHGRTLAVVSAAGSASMHVVATHWILAGLERGGLNGPGMVTLLALMFGGVLAGMLVISMLIARRFASAFTNLPDLHRFWLTWVCGWMLNDALRLIGPLAFPYLQTGVILAEMPGASGWLPVVGAEGWAGLLLTCLTILGSCWGRPGSRPCRVALQGAALLVVVISIGEGLGRVQWTTRIAMPPTPVLALQTNFTRDSKWDDTARETAFQWMEDTVRQAPNGTVIITPELYFIDAAQLIPASRMDALEASARQHGIDLLIGMPYAVIEQEYAPGSQSPTDRPEPIVFNAMAHLSPRRSDLYAKEKLVAFGEYTVASQLLGAIYRDALAFPLNNLTPAPSSLTDALFVAGRSVGASICFESSFPWTMASRAKNAHWLLNIANNAWFDSSILNRQTLAATKVRAREMGRQLLVVSNVGITALIGPDGRIIRSLPEGARRALAVDVFSYDGATLYGRLTTEWPGWPPTLIGALFTAMLCIGAKIRPPPHAAAATRLAEET